MHLIQIAAAALIVLVSVIAGTALWLAHHADRRAAGTEPTRRPSATRPKVPLHKRIRDTAKTLSGPPVGVLVIGAVVLCGLTVLFAYVFDSVLEGDGITAVDQPTVAWLAGHRHPVQTLIMRALSIIGSPVAAAAVALVICTLVAWRIRNWLPVVVAALGMAGYGLMSTAVKLVVHRQRPPLPYSVVAAHGYSFPSGHAMGIATSALISAWALDHWMIRSVPARVATWTAAIVIIAGVGFSRVYLGVHYPSDVIAGWALGIIWASVVIAFAALYEQRTGMRARAANDTSEAGRAPAGAPPSAPTQSCRRGSGVGLPAVNRPSRAVP